MSTTNTKPVSTDKLAHDCPWDLSHAIALGDLPIAKVVAGQRSIPAAQVARSVNQDVRRGLIGSRSTSWSRAGLIGAALLLALAACIGWIRSNEGNDSGRLAFKSDRVHVAVAISSLDLSDRIALSDGGRWQLAKANIEEIRVGMRVPAHNPQLSPEDREAGKFTVAPKTWRTFKLTVDKEDATGDLEVTLLRPASWLVDELDTIALLALMAEFENASGGLSEPSAAATSLKRGARWVNEVSQIVSLTEISLLALGTINAFDATRFGKLSNPGLFFFGEFSDAIQSECLALAEAELNYASAIDSVLAGDGVGSQIYLEMPELVAVGLATITAIDACPRIKDGPGQIVTATFRHSSAEVLDLRFTPTSSSSLRSTASSLRSTASSLTLGVTAAHPFWSVDREDFVAAGQLQRGEQVIGIDDQHFRLTSITARAGPETVYNFEVAIDHVYYVGEGGLLVHNAYIAKLMQKSWTGIKKAANGVASRLKLRRASKSLGDALDTPMTILYHGGKLDNPTKAFLSATDSLAHATQFAARHGGTVHAFNIPTRTFMELQRKGLIHGPLRDQLLNTTQFATEFRIFGDAINAFTKIIP